MDEPLLLEEHPREDSPLLLEETVDRREMTASSFYQRHCIYLPAMMGWFICSAALSSYNKVSDCQRVHYQHLFTPRHRTYVGQFSVLVDYIW